MDRLLIVGALRAETLPILQALRRPRPLTPRLVCGELDGHDVAVLTCGIGPRCATRHTRRALHRFHAAHVLSVGTCGALVDHLQVGDVLTAARLQPQDTPPATPSPWPGLPAVTVVTVNEPVWSAPRREALAVAGAQVCEMEALAVYTTLDAQRFSAIKVVSDHAGREASGTLDPPTPIARLRFARRAHRLCRDALLPALRQGLSALPS